MEVILIITLDLTLNSVPLQRRESLTRAEEKQGSPPGPHAAAARAAAVAEAVISARALPVLRCHSRRGWLTDRAARAGSCIVVVIVVIVFPLLSISPRGWCVCVCVCRVTLTSRPSHPLWRAGGRSGMREEDRPRSRMQHQAVAAAAAGASRQANQHRPCVHAGYAQRQMRGKGEKRVSWTGPGLGKGGGLVLAVRAFFELWVAGGCNVRGEGGGAERATGNWDWGHGGTGLLG